MEPLTGFEESYSVPDGDIIKELTEIPEKSELSREGACGYFYEQMADSGSNFLFVKDNDHLVCYADHDEVLEGTESDNCKFFIQNDRNRTVIMLINRDGNYEINIPLTFKHDTERDRRALVLIKKTALLNVCFLSIAYGSLFKDRLIKFKLPENIAAQLPG